jgi:hypothetical protein
MAGMQHAQEGLPELRLQRGVLGLEIEKTDVHRLIMG